MADNIGRMVTALKNQGNKALDEGNVNNAILFYTSAIELDPSNHVLYSDRSAAYAKIMDYISALEDAEKTIEMRSDWSKGYSRKGAALAYLKCYKEAIETYEQGLKYDANDVQLKEGLKEVKELLAHENNSFKDPFKDPSVLLKLHNDPRTKYFFHNPKYAAMVSNLISDPTSMISLSLHDTEILTTSSVILDIDLSKVDIDLSKGDDGDNDKQIEETKEMPIETNITEKRIKESEQEKNDSVVNNVDWYMKELLVIKDKLITKKHELKKKSNELFQIQYKTFTVYKEVDELKSKLVTALENQGSMALNAGNVDSAIQFYCSAIELNPFNHVLYSNRSAAYAKAMKYADALTDIYKAVKIKNDILSGQMKDYSRKEAALVYCEERIAANNVQLKAQTSERTWQTSCLV